MTDTPPTRIAIVGLGAVGGLLAARLAALGDRVRLSALARGATRAAVQRDGLVLHDARGTHAVPLAVHEDPAALGPQDLVLMAVKGPALAAAAPAVAALCAPHTAVLQAMNGVPWWFFDHGGGAAAGLRLASVDPGDRVRALIPTARVIGAVVHFSASTPAPGQVHHAAGQGLILGRPDGRDDAPLRHAAALLQAAGFETTVSPHIQRDIWFKLWGNMTFNPVSALTGATGDRILADDLVREFVSAVMREAQAVGTAVGVPIAQTPEQRHEVTRQLGAFRTSMLQDLEAGRPLEIDALVGAVHEIGRHLGHPLPHTGALLGLVRLLARTRGLLPD
jgi:2-dehydropantoate 2-reductase